MHALLRSTLVLSLLGASAAQAATITVTSVPYSPVAVPDSNWYLTNYRDDSNGFTSNTVAAITNTQARSGNGSVEMSLTDGSGKADYAYNWGFVTGRTLGNLNALGYDWMRAGGTSNADLQPAMRLSYDTDGNAATTNDRGYLIWEQVYNGATAQNQWVSSDILGGNFWQRQFSPGLTVENFDTTLFEWINGPRPANADQLSAATAITGIEFGIGSGWNGTFQGFVDNVRFGFVGEDSTTFNFETAAAQVPEPASMALLGLGAFGIMAARRRRQR